MDLTLTGKFVYSVFFIYIIYLVLNNRSLLIYKFAPFINPNMIVRLGMKDIDRFYIGKANKLRIILQLSELVNKAEKEVYSTFTEKSVNFLRRTEQSTYRDIVLVVMLYLSIKNGHTPFKKDNLLTEAEDLYDSLEKEVTEDGLINGMDFYPIIIYRLKTLVVLHKYDELGDALVKIEENTMNSLDQKRKDILTFYKARYYYEKKEDVSALETLTIIKRSFSYNHDVDLKYLFYIEYMLGEIEFRNNNHLNAKTHFSQVKTIAGKISSTEDTQKILERMEKKVFTEK